MLIVGALTAALDTTEALRLTVDPAVLGLPPTCRSVPTEACLLDEIQQSGFTVVERYGSFEQFFYGDHPLSRINPHLSPRVPWSLQTLVLGLQRSAPADPGAADQWFRGQPLPEADLAEQDVGEAAARIIRQFSRENAALHFQVRDLTGTLSDRELALDQERSEWEKQNKELLLRTSRLENAHAALCTMEAAINNWRAAESAFAGEDVPSPRVE